MIVPSSRIVVTGVAASTCCGVGVERLFRRLARGFPGHERPQPEGGATSNSFKKFAGLSHDVSDLIRKTRTDDLLTQHVFAAVDCDLGATLRPLDEDLQARTGVVIGNSSGNFQSYFTYFATATKEGYEFVNPMHFPSTLLNYSTVQLNNAFSLKSSSTTISSGFAAGLEAIGYAASRLQAGKDKILLAGGVEEINHLILALLAREKTISTSGLVQPFQAERDGMIPGEGVGILMLETLHEAHQDGKTVLAEILGYGSANGTRQIGSPFSHQKAADAIYQALEQADMTPDDVEAIFSSANGSIEGDTFDLQVLQHVFGSSLASIAVYPIKAITGDCFTASGPLQCIAAIYAMTSTQKNHNSGMHTAHGGPEGMLLPDTIRACTNALIYSFGLDQSYAALVLGKGSANSK